MEYLKSINQKLNKIDESNMEYIDLFEYPEFFYGNVNLATITTNFCKVPNRVQKEAIKYGENVKKSMDDFNSSSTGNRLRFYTTSPRIILKIQLKRKWGFIKMSNWNALGFDIYSVDKGKYVHRAILAPMDGHGIFAKSIKVPKSHRMCIFLPSYNTIEKMYLGIEKDSEIRLFNYKNENKVPIIFYGNSITQGSSASRSGNIFPNIISRKMDRDIINLSVSNCCKGMDGMADMIGKLNCHSIIIDYTRNATNKDSFKKSFIRFYERIRTFHPDKKIIIMTSSCFNYYKRYDEFDEILKEYYQELQKRGDNTYLFNQKSLFDEDEYDYVTIDSAHYTDYGMHKIANKICELIR